MKYKDKKYITIDNNKHISYIWGNKGNGHYTQKEELYLTHLTSLLPNFTGGKVLEIGPGTGKFGVLLNDQYTISSYTILDLEKNIKDSEKTFKENNIKGEFIMSQEYTTLFKRDFDILISNVCLSETPDYYREDILNNILKNCKYCFIIDGDGYKVEYNKWLTNTIKKYYNTVKIIKSGYANCMVIAAQNIKDET